MRTQEDVYLGSQEITINPSTNSEEALHEKERTWGKVYAILCFSPPAEGESVAEDSPTTKVNGSQGRTENGFLHHHWT